MNSRQLGRRYFRHVFMVLSLVKRLALFQGLTNLELILQMAQFDQPMAYLSRQRSCGSNPLEQHFQRVAAPAPTGRPHALRKA